MPKDAADRGLILFAALMAAWLLIGLPFLYWPGSPHPKERHTASEATQPSNQEPRGTASAPYVVQVIPGPKSAEERAQEAEDRDEKKEADRWLVRWTAALFAATVGLILATGVLGFFAWRQMHDMKASVDASTRQAKVAEDSLTNLERPWIFVHLAPKLRSRASHFGTQQARGLDEWLSKTDPIDDPPLAIFDIANHGRMPAVIDGCYVQLGNVPIALDDERNIEIPGGLLRDEFHGAIGPNEKKTNFFLDCPAGVEYGVIVDVVTGQTDPVPSFEQNAFFVFFIEIEYLDVADKRHKSGFCWRFDRAVNYWVQYGGPKYNYQT